MHFNGEVTLGALLQIATMITVAVGLFYKITAKIDAHAEALTRHAETLGDHEDDIKDLIRQVSILIGWQQSQAGRRQIPRLVPPVPLPDAEDEGV